MGIKRSRVVILLALLYVHCVSAMPSYWLPINDPASAQYNAQVMAVLKDSKFHSSRVPVWPSDTGTPAATGMTSKKWLAYRALLWNVIRYYLKPGTTDW